MLHDRISLTCEIGFIDFKIVGYEHNAVYGNLITRTDAKNIILNYVV